MKSFTAGVVQWDVALGRVSDNVTTAMDRLTILADRGTDLAVLPEMWSCGFDLENLTAHAAHTPAILDRLGQMAASRHMAIAGSLPEAVGDRVANTFYLIDDCGRIAAAYRKIHLFRPGSEHLHFTAGDATVTADLPMGRLGLVTCYDLRFPELSRMLTVAGIDCLLVAAQWPRVRSGHWDVLLRARAIENQVFVIAANRCGSDPHLDYAGGSCIISPWGETLARADDRDTLIEARLDPQALTRAREAIPCLKDRRPHAYGEMHRD
ncbi:carbon-nitrogen family hydrolase [Desulfatiferula olefinivorans]